MNLNDYPSNSNASRIKRTEDIQEKTVHIPADREVKKTPTNKFLSSLFADDLINIKEYILWDVLMPAFKNAISDTVCNGIDMLLFGQTSSGRRANGGKVNYSGIYSGGLSSSRVIRLNDDRNERRMPSGTSGYSYQEIALSRAEAEDVLYILRQKEAQYGLVSVTDMYDAITEVLHYDPFKDVREFTDNKWGWSDISRARYDRVANGFVLRMPRLEPL